MKKTLYFFVLTTIFITNLLPEIVWGEEATDISQTENSLETENENLENGPQFYDYKRSTSTYSVPKKDVEISYDPNMKTLVYRFKEDSIGTDGQRDNYASERFMTRLAENNIVEYDANMMANDNVQKYILEMPFSVYQGFSGAKTSLKIITNQLEITLPYDFLNPKIFREMNSDAEDLDIKFVIETIKEPYNEANYHYAIPPFKISLYVNGLNEEVAVEYLDKEFEIEMIIDKDYYARGESIIVLENIGNDREFANAKFTKADSSFTFKTYNISSFAAASIDPLPMTTGGWQSEEVFNNVMKKIYITDMKVYNPLQEVTSKEFGNILLAVANDEKKVALGRALTIEEINELTKAGLFVSEPIVTFKDGMNALRNLYQIKTKYSIENTNQLQEMLDLTTRTNLTFGDLMYTIDIVLKEVSEKEG